MELWEGLKIVHVLAAIVWIGGSFMIQLFVVRARSSGDPERLATVAKEVGYLGNRTFVPASLLLVITGFWIIAELDLDYQGWIVFGLAVWGASFVNGAMFLGPESGRVGELIESKGAGDPEVQSRLGRVFLLSRIELVLLVLVVIAMIAKIPE